MVGADSSSLVAFLKGESGADVTAIDEALATQQLRLPPAVVTETLSNPATVAATYPLVAPIPMLDLLDGFWLRAAQSRAHLLSRGLKARLGDALIAQACIDADVPLITRDKNFRHFAAHCGLKLA